MSELILESISLSNGMEANPMADNLQTPAPEIIKIPLPNQANPLLFPDMDSILSWIEREIEFWGWLEKIRSLQLLSELYNAPIQAWNQVRDRANVHKKEGDEKKRQHIRDEIRSILTKLYNEDRYSMPSISPQAQYVNSLKDQNAKQAAYALLAFLRQDKFPSPSPADGMIGLIKSMLFDQGLIQEAATAQKASLQLVSNEWHQLLETMQTQQKDFEETSQKLASRFEEILSSKETSFDEKLSDAGKKLKDIEATYDTRLALQAPVDYWDKKEKYHIAQSKMIGSYCAWGAVALLALVLVEIWLLVDPFSSTPKLDYWRWSFILATAAFLIWPVRIGVRFFHSNMHLREDAMERVTMTKTYLSLLRSGQGLEESDRKLIIEALFRPTAKGVVTEEIDTSIVQVVSRMFSGK